MIACSKNLYATAEPLPCFDSAPEQALPATGDAARIAEKRHSYIAPDSVNVTPSAVPSDLGDTEKRYFDELAQLRADNATLSRQLAEAREELERAWITHGDLRESSEHLKDQLAASEKDKARIDWLETGLRQTDARHQLVRIERGWKEPLLSVVTYDGQRTSSHTEDTLRAAIDAAMKEAR